MTREDFVFLIHTQQEYEFSFNGINYNMTYDRDKDGNPLIVFGERYQGEKYDSAGDLLNRAKIGNCWFREILPEL